jgi:hypothetical protein
MNIAKALSKAQGDETIISIVKSDSPTADLKLEAMRMQWLDLNNTKQLIEFLEAEQKTFLQHAMNLASSGASKKPINKALVKAQTIKEILIYVRENRRDNPKPGE